VKKFVLLFDFTNGPNIRMDTNEIMARNNGGDSELYPNAQSGGVVINSFASTTHELYVNGTAAKQGGGLWTASSDARLKVDVKPFTQGLEEVMQIEAATYQFLPSTARDVSVEHVGVIVQDLLKVAPTIVKEGTLELVDGTTGDYLSADP